MADGRRLSGLGGLLPYEAWRALIDDGHIRRYKPGAVLVRQGEPGGFVLALVAGLIKVTRDESDGSQLLLAVRGPGEVVGDISALAGGPRSATVTALDCCETTVLAAGRFRELMTVHDSNDVLFRHAFGRLREREDRWAEKATLPAGRLVARELLRMAAQSGDAVVGLVALNLRLSQDDLARCLGLSRSAVAGELQRLRALGVVSTARRRVIIRDLRRLEALAEHADAWPMTAE
ncbi:Crp/Fnr family transcriptional regulator [Actinoallomurus vinaceus]|uniref:Crp/Fnr family transcriptional regulator n=1 Tax=Actinoallomurus vinaceus TaxID=1080074 RepID=A0ABP8UN31_9ACTN